MVGAAVGVLPDLIGAGGAYAAGEAQAEAAKYAADLQYRMYDEDRKRQEPFLGIGQRALPELENLSRYKDFDMATFEADPGLAYRLAAGEKSLKNMLSAGGRMFSGDALKAATRYGQEFGTQEYTNAFNRYRTQRNEQVNALRTLAGVGQTTANTLSTAGQNAATQAGKAIGAGGDARASQYMGMANAFAGGVNSYLNYGNRQT